MKDSIQCAVFVFTLALNLNYLSFFFPLNIYSYFTVSTTDIDILDIDQYSIFSFFKHERKYWGVPSVKKLRKLTFSTVAVVVAVIEAHRIQTRVFTLLGYLFSHLCL